MPRSEASSAARPPPVSSAVSKPRSAGILITRPGFRTSRRAATPASGSGRPADVAPRIAVGGRNRFAPVPDDVGSQQAVAADLRQADDLLFALDFVAERYPGNP